MIVDTIKTGIESLWLSIKAKNKTLLLCTIYRPPDSDSKYYDHIMDEIQKAKDTGYETIIMGDLNYNYESNGNNPIKFIENRFDLKQIISSPTRVNLNSSTLIYVILTDKKEKHVNTKVIEDSMNDHYCIYTEYRILKETKEGKHKVVTYRDYKKINMELFLDLNNSSAITRLNFAPEDMNTAWTDFKTAFTDISNKLAPIKTSRLNDRHNPWMTNDVVELIYKRDYVKKQAIKHKDQHK